MYRSLIIIALYVIISGCSKVKPVTATGIQKNEITIEERNFTVDGVTISTTLTITPKAKKIVMIIPGSGPTDRDGNNNQGLKTDAYKMISEKLIKEDIASLRIDKRGIGKSIVKELDESKVTFDLYIDDFRTILSALRDQGFSKVFLLGHSEGALVSTIIANNDPIEGLISIAGAAKSLDSVIITQINAQFPVLAEEARIVIDSINAGHIVTQVNPMLFSLFRPSVQPHLRSLFKYDPRKEMSKVQAPTAIIHGTTDLQVPITAAQSLAKQNKKAQLHIIDQMNHALKKAPMDRAKNLATYYDASLPLHPEVMPAIVDFISRN